MLDLLQEAGLLGCRPLDTPIEANLQFGTTVSPSTDKDRFQRLIGKLLYLSLTRLDIAFSVNVLNQHLTNPTEEHMAAAYRVLRYLK